MKKRNAKALANRMLSYMILEYAARVHLDDHALAASLERKLRTTYLNLIAASGRRLPHRVMQAFINSGTFKDVDPARAKLPTPSRPLLNRRKRPAREPA